MRDEEYEAIRAELDEVKLALMKSGAAMLALTELLEKQQSGMRTITRGLSALATAVTVVAERQGDRTPNP